MTLTSPTQVPTGSIYTDNTGLRQIAARSESDPQAALRQAAQQFEAIFVQMMMSSMRAGKLAEGAMDSDATRFYQDLHDKQMGLVLSGGGDDKQPSRLGIADMLIRQLGGPDGAIKPSTAAPDPSAGRPAQAGSTQAASASGASTSDDSLSTLLAGQSPFTPAALTPAAIDPQALAPVDTQASHAHALAALKRFAPEFGVGNGALPAAAGAPSMAPDTVGVADADADKADVSKAAAVSAARSADASRSALPARFDSPEHFVSSLWEAASSAADELGVAPQVLLAQAALETGWGKHLPRHADGTTSHNLFGIKATRHWHGDRVQQMTSEFENGRFAKRADAFRAYDNFADSFKDYVNLLQNSSRYKTAVASTDNPTRFYSELQRAGYATDPNYANKLSKLLASDTMRNAVAGRSFADASAVSGRAAS